MVGHRLPKGPIPYVLTTWTSFRDVSGWDEEDEEGAEKEGVHGCLHPRTSTDVHGHHKLEENLTVLKGVGRWTLRPGLWAYGKGWRWTLTLLRPVGWRHVAMFYPFGCPTPYAPRVCRMPYAIPPRRTPKRKNQKEIAIFHYQIRFP
jgi:hypothetical protein